MRLILILLFLVVINSVSAVEFFPRYRRYQYVQSDLKLNLGLPSQLPTVKEYENIRDLLDEELQQKFPNYEEFIKNSLNEYSAKSILIKSLDLLAKNHRLKKTDVSRESLQAFNLVLAYFKIDFSLSFDQKINQLDQLVHKIGEKNFRLPGFYFGELPLTISPIKKSLESFVEINDLESNISFENSD